MTSLSRKPLHRLAVAFAATGAVIALLAAGAASADPGSRTRDWSGTVTGPNGGVSTFDHSRTRGPGAASRQTDVTGPDGGQRGRTVNRAWDRDNGTGSMDRSTTYRDGTSSSTSRTVTGTGEGSYDVETTRTNRRGEVRTRSGTVTVDP